MTLDDNSGEEKDYTAASTFSSQSEEDDEIEEEQLHPAEVFFRNSRAPLNFWHSVLLSIAQLKF